MAKILIIEDHPDTREVLRLILEMDGYEIAEAQSGEEGLRLARAAPPELILMDISLAGELDGLETTRRLRADRVFDQTVIIALTAHAMKGDREMTFEAGCDGYWTKPIIDFGEFRGAVKNAVEYGRLFNGQPTAHKG